MTLKEKNKQLIRKQKQELASEVRTTTNSDVNHKKSNGEDAAIGKAKPIETAPIKSLQQKTELSRELNRTATPVKEPRSLPRDVDVNHDDVSSKSESAGFGSMLSMWENRKAKKHAAFDATRDEAFDSSTMGRLKGAKALFENMTKRSHSEDLFQIDRNAPESPKTPSRMITDVRSVFEQKSKSSVVTRSSSMKTKVRSPLSPADYASSPTIKSHSSVSLPIDENAAETVNSNASKIADSYQVDANTSENTDSHAVKATNSNVVEATDSNAATAVDTDVAENTDAELANTTDSHVSETADSNAATAVDADAAENTNTTGSNVVETTDSNAATAVDADAAENTDTTGSNVVETTDSNAAENTNTSDSNVVETTDSNAATAVDADAAENTDAELANTADPNVSETADSNVATSVISDAAEIGDVDSVKATNSNVSETVDSGAVLTAASNTVPATRTRDLSSGDWVDDFEDEDLSDAAVLSSESSDDENYSVELK